LGLKQAAFASVSMRVSHLLKGDRPATAELALCLGRALGQSLQYWLSLQAAYDIKTVQAAMQDSLACCAGTHAGLSCSTGGASNGFHRGHHFGLKAKYIHHPNLYAARAILGGRGHHRLRDYA
jgi:plasmid maintenance system antidote protein VapI